MIHHNGRLLRWSEITINNVISNVLFHLKYLTPNKGLIFKLLLFELSL